MTNGINTRELILQILLEIEEEGNTVTLRFVMPSPNTSSFQDRRVALSPEYVRELWNIVF